MPPLDTNYYLAALDLRGKACLVVGAGSVGREKIAGLIECGANVRVVARDVDPEVGQLAAGGHLQLFERAYTTTDLEGCFLAIAATSDADLNQRIFAEADGRGMLINVVDAPALCNFILPAVTRRGPIAIAISTSEASPALAKRMKREAAELFGVEYGHLALMLNELRPWAQSSLPTYSDRREYFEAIVNGDPGPIELLRAGDAEAVRERLAAAQRRGLPAASDRPR